MRILSAKFLASANELKSAPDFGVSEVAFLGRSNVGKSSLINALVGVNGLAKSSSTPGKTQLINFFEVVFAGESKFENGEKTGEKTRLVFVDLPGFGYAKVSKSMHEAWRANMDEFLKKRLNLRLFVHLVDSRHPNLATDANLQNYLKSFVRGDQKVLKVFTKSDKLTQSEKAQILKFDKEALLVSASKKSGVSRAVDAIFSGVFGSGI